jgi:hypothetical protein
LEYAGHLRAFVLQEFPALRDKVFVKQDLRRPEHLGKEIRELEAE